MENIVIGLTNTEILDIKMAETQNKKKTRRGKKNGIRKLTGNTSDVFSTFAIDNTMYRHTHTRNRRYIRPTSPKAPMNSTQFLIEDKINFDVSPQNYNSPVCHGLSPEIEDFSSYPFYDTDNHTNQMKQKYKDGELEYMPIDFDETADFIDQEFEKDFNNYHHHHSADNFSDGAATKSLRRELSKLPKYTIIQKMLKLDVELKRLDKERRERPQTSLKLKMDQLRTENKSLTSDNTLLKNLLS